jgi:hypothetical protein
MTTEEIFTEQFLIHDRGNEAPVAWDGSTLQQTRNLIASLPHMFRRLNVSTLLDAGCGDFHWMNRLVPDDVAYVGADIVVPLLERNRRKHPRANVEFRRLDLLDDEIPRADLIICRDVLDHYSFDDALRVVASMCRSGCPYLLATTYTDRESNRDIATGQWRVLNMQRAPFSFPPPLEVLVEGCTEADGAFADKAQGLWRLRDVEACLPPAHRN